MRRTNFSGFVDTNGSPYLSQTTRHSERQQKNRTYWILEFAIPTDHRVEVNEREKKDKYRDLARELEILSNTRVTVIPVVVEALSTVTKGLMKGLEDLVIRGRVETIQLPEYWESWRFEQTCCHSDSRGKPFANANEKNSQMSKIIIIVVIIWCTWNGLPKLGSNRESKKESRPSRLQHFPDRLIYWVEFWSFE